MNHQNLTNQNFTNLCIDHPLNTTFSSNRFTSTYNTLPSASNVAATTTPSLTKQCKPHIHSASTSNPRQTIHCPPQQ